MRLIYVMLLLKSLNLQFCLKKTPFCKSNYFQRGKTKFNQSTDKWTNKTSVLVFRTILLLRKINFKSIIILNKNDFVAYLPQINS